MILIALLLSCSPQHKRDWLPKSDLSEFDKMASTLVIRLQLEHLEFGYVVSRDGFNGPAAHEGDSLLWSGLALALLPCEAGKEIFDSLYLSVKMGDGELVRFPGLNQRPSRDAAIGFLFGMAFRAINCPADYFEAREAVELHLHYVARHNGKLSPSGPELTSVTRYTYQKVAEYLEITTGTKSDKLSFELGVMAGARAIKAQKSAGYPVHLSTLQILLLDKIGKGITNNGKGWFCDSSKGMGLGLTDLYCDRTSAKLLLEQFSLNEYEYKWQRARWEKPDGHGLLSPAIDWLAIYFLGRKES